MDITPEIPKDQKIIKSYGESFFKVNDEEYSENIIVQADKVTTWEVSCFDEINTCSFSDLDESIEILIISCGEKHLPLDPKLQSYFHEKNISVEVMTTAAACRTYNILLSEGRQVAAALLKV